MSHFREHNQLSGANEKGHVARLEKMLDQGADKRAGGIPRRFEESTTKAVWTRGLVVWDREHCFFDIGVRDSLTETYLLLHGEYLS